MIRSSRSSSYSLVSMVMTFHFSSTNSLVRSKFHGDTSMGSLLVFPSWVLACVVIWGFLPQSRHFQSIPHSQGLCGLFGGHFGYIHNVWRCYHRVCTGIYHSRTQGLNRCSAHNNQGSVEWLNSQMTKCCLLGSPLYFITLFEFEFYCSPQIWSINAPLAAIFSKYFP